MKPENNDLSFYLPILPQDTTFRKIIIFTSTKNHVDFKQV